MKKIKLVYYYIMVDPDKPSKCKVGITIDPEQRLVAYRTASPQCFFKVLYKNINISHEKKILYLLKEIVQVDREYVHMNPSIVKNIIEGYFDDNEVKY